MEVARNRINGHSIKLASGSCSGVGTKFKDLWDACELSTINYDAKTGVFTAGLTITGGTSGATAVIVINDDSGSTGVLTVRKAAGDFQDNETITDTSTGSATVDGIRNEIIALTYPTSGQTWEVVCENSNDASAGTGANSIIINYLDTNYIEQTEIVNLNGHSLVTLTATNAFRFTSATVISWGSATDALYGKTNLGFIVIRDSSTKNIQGSIAFEDRVAGDGHGLNSSQSSHFTIPAGKTGHSQFFLVNTIKNQDVSVRALIRQFNSDAFFSGADISIYQNAVVEDLSLTPTAFEEKMDFKLIARSDNPGAIVSAVHTLFFVDS